MTTATTASTDCFQCGSTRISIQAQVTDLQKPKSPILTGIGFLDHMLDQFNSHAQIGIAVTVNEEEGGEQNGKNSNEMDQKNRLADKLDQTLLFTELGKLLGTEFYRILTTNNLQPNSHSYFGCPLDEALVLVDVTFLGPQNGSQQSDGDGLLEYTNMTPYGSYPPITGRSHLGRMELTPTLYEFWKALAQAAHLRIAFEKIVGDNAHHIVEASFKAFSRALRNLIDGINTEAESGGEGAALQQLYGPSSPNAAASIALSRVGTVQRKTKETSITAQLSLDGGQRGTKVTMGLDVLDQFWTVVSQHAAVSLQASCQGDLWIDEHHTAEDVAIALGQVWNQALGDKAGLNRMWCATHVQGATQVLVVLDLSNRPMLTHNLPLTRQSSGYLGSVPVEMLEHVLDSFVVNARLTLQIYVTKQQTKTDGMNNGVDDSNGNNDISLQDAWDGLAVALGRALRYCIMVDQRRAGATASSKGTLSV